MKKILLVDNFDSFTYNLVHLLEEAGANCQVLRNDDPRLFAEAEQCRALVLSPGPCTPIESGQMMSLIDSFHKRKPILGICLGHQAIGQFFGASLVRAPKPMHGKISALRTEADAWIQSPGESYAVMRYHSLVLEQLPPVLRPLAWSEDGCLMAFRHCDLPLFGLQFHPESIGTAAGAQLIRAFVAQID